MYKLKSRLAKVKAGPEAGLAEGEFLVYPSTFTREPDSYGDIVAKGAFARGIAARKEKGISLPGLFGHRMDDPDMVVAYALDEGEDDHGWWVKGMFDLDSPKGPQTYRLVKSGRLRELSFAFDVLDEGQVEVDGGRKANELRDLDVFEFSFVHVGANRDTSVVAVKSAVDALVGGVAGGQLLTAKHLEDLRGVVETLDATVLELKNVLPQSGAGEDQAKADAAVDDKDEEPGAAKSEDLGEQASATSDWARHIKTLEFSSLY